MSHLCQQLQAPQTMQFSVAVSRFTRVFVGLQLVAASFGINSCSSPEGEGAHGGQSQATIREPSSNSVPTVPGSGESLGSASANVDVQPLEMDKLIEKVGASSFISEQVSYEEVNSSYLTSDIDSDQVFRNVREILQHLVVRPYNGNLQCEYRSISLSNSGFRDLPRFSEDLQQTGTVLSDSILGGILETRIIAGMGQFTALGLEEKRVEDESKPEQIEWDRDYIGKMQDSFLLLGDRDEWSSSSDRRCATFYSRDRMTLNIACSTVFPTFGEPSIGNETLRIQKTGQTVTGTLHQELLNGISKTIKRVEHSIVENVSANMYQLHESVKTPNTESGQLMLENNKVFRIRFEGSGDLPSRCKSITQL